MIGYLILIVVQIIAAWFGAPMALKYIPLSGDPRLFVHAALFAVIAWFVGIVGSFVLKEVRMPTSSTLATSLVLALIGAGIMLVPSLVQAIPLKFPPLYLPLAGAIIGYMIRR